MLANFYGGVTAGVILGEENNEIKEGAKEADLDGTSVAHPIGSRSDRAINGTKKKGRNKTWKSRRHGFQAQHHLSITAPLVDDVAATLLGQHDAQTGSCR